MDATHVLLIASSFVLAGFVKGMTGLGLPTVAVGLLGLMMAPAQAVALLLVPSLATNLWQLAAGGNLVALLQRLWPMLLGICAGTAAGTALGLHGGADAGFLLGLALIGYAALGLSRVRLALGARVEDWLAPLAGACTGAVTAATGVFVIPAVPYLQALGLDKDELVQALGLSFTVSTLAIGVALIGNGAFAMPQVLASSAALVPAGIGMFVGQRLRARVPAHIFRTCFFLALLLLGAHLALKPLL